MGETQAQTPAGVALMRIVMAAASPEEVEGRLQAEDAGALTALWRAHPQFWKLAKALQAIVDHDAKAPDARAIADAFDRAAALSPDAACALYALGDLSRLDAATAEVVDHLAALGLLAPRARVLDIGCGAGRFERALAGRVGSLLGLEVSAVMASAARARCAALANVEFALCKDGAPPPLRAGSFQLALAVDAFPYIVQCGGALAAQWFAAVARALAPGGAFVIANFSYRGDLRADADEAARLAGQVGLHAKTLGQSPFFSWDAAVFRFEKP